MKKYVLLLIPFLLTGCFGEVGKGNLSTTCIKIEYSSNIVETKKYEIEFSKGNINKITYTNSFESDSIDMSNAIKSYKKSYENEVGVDITINGNSIIYIFSYDEISDNIKKEFDLTSKYNDQIKKLKGSGFTCD